MPAFFEPLAAIFFPHQWTCGYITQRVILGAMVWELKDDSQPPCCLAPSARDICLENHVLNIPFMKSFAKLFMVKSGGWNTCIMFGGIFVDKMLLSFSMCRNLSVVCPLKTSYLEDKQVVVFQAPNLSHSVFIYGRMISLRNFKDSLS